jgi:hypothetical protein
MTGGTPRLAVEDNLASRGGRSVEAALWWRGDGQLVELQRGQFRGDQVRIAADIAEPARAATGKRSALFKRGS